MLFSRKSIFCIILTLFTKSNKTESAAFLFLKCHIRIKIDLIVVSVTNLIHDKQNVKRFKEKIKEF